MVKPNGPGLSYFLHIPEALEPLSDHLHLILSKDILVRRDVIRDNISKDIDDKISRRVESRVFDNTFDILVQRSGDFDGYLVHDRLQSGYS